MFAGLTQLEDLAAPTVVAAIVSALALVLRDVLGRRGERDKLTENARRHDDDVSIRGQELLLKQIESLWRENAASRAREAESRQRCRDLEKRCEELVARCAQLQQMLDQLRSRLDRVDRDCPPEARTSTLPDPGSR